MLEKINCPDDLKKLSVDQLPELCQEIRQLLIDVVLRNGGHLASNLGVVELTVALHYVYGERDKIVWDVGHQAYVHKILTGRRKEFETLRKRGGISGFTDTSESEADAFGAGHSGTSISAALGLTKARDLQGQDYDVVAVCGDGALTGGMTFEALNNIDGEKMLIIFNDNEMSIGKNVGSTASMSRLRIGKYDIRKERAKKFVNSIPLVGKPMWQFLRWLKRIFKFGILETNLYFSSFDLKYVGVVDGHDVKKLVLYLKNIKNNVIRPTVLHVRTKKGKGYEPAEKEPSRFHGINPENEKKCNTMSGIVGQTLSDLAKGDDKIVAVTAAMADGTGLNIFQKRHPDRFFDTGIAEEHAVTFCAGLAAQGMKPYFVVYSTFLQRGFDQVLHDVCLQNLPVTFCIDRAGFVGADGKTHQGVFDLSYLSAIPNMTVWSPAGEKQLADMLRLSKDFGRPLAIRYPKEAAKFGFGFDGKWNRVIEGNEAVLLPTGSRMLKSALAAAEKFGLGVVYAGAVKPLDVAALEEMKSAKIIFTLEENVLQGGFGQAVREYFARGTAVTRPKVVSFGAPDKFIAHGTIGEQLREAGLDAESVTAAVERYLKNV